MKYIVVDGIMFDFSKFSQINFNDITNEDNVSMYNVEMHSENETIIVGSFETPIEAENLMNVIESFIESEKRILKIED